MTLVRGYYIIIMLRYAKRKRIYRNAYLAISSFDFAVTELQNRRLRLLARNRAECRMTFWIVSWGSGCKRSLPIRRWAKIRPGRKTRGKVAGNAIECAIILRIRLPVCVRYSKYSRARCWSTWKHAETQGQRL